MNKSFFKVLFFGLLGGVAGGYFFVSLSGFYSADISQTVISVPRPTPVSGQGFWEKIISESALSSVGIQVFESNRLVKQGSGIIVSSDGLIATVADFGVANAVYQVLYEDKIIRGKIVSADYNLNLILIKTDSSYSKVADLSGDDYNSGQEVILIGKLLDLSEPITFSQKGIISYVTQKGVIIDTVAGNNLSGAGVVDSNGDFAGLAYLRGGKINMVRGVSIGDFFQKYSAQNK